VWRIVCREFFGAAPTEESNRSMTLNPSRLRTHICADHSIEENEYGIREGVIGKERGGRRRIRRGAKGRSRRREQRIGD
jgi:hypothetical protein